MIRISNFKQNGSYKQNIPWSWRTLPSTIGPTQQSDTDHVLWQIYQNQNFRTGQKFCFQTCKWHLRVWSSILQYMFIWWWTGLFTERMKMINYLYANIFQLNILRTRQWNENVFWRIGTAQKWNIVHHWIQLRMRQVLELLIAGVWSTRYSYLTRYLLICLYVYASYTSMVLL